MCIREPKLCYCYFFIVLAVLMYAWETPWSLVQNEKQCSIKWSQLFPNFSSFLIFQTKNMLAWCVPGYTLNDHKKSQNCRYRCCCYLHQCSSWEPLAASSLTVWSSEIKQINPPACSIRPASNTITRYCAVCENRPFKDLFMS